MIGTTLTLVSNAELGEITQENFPFYIEVEAVSTSMQGGDIRVYLNMDIETALEDYLAVGESENISVPWDTVNTLQRIEVTYDCLKTPTLENANKLQDGENVLLILFADSYDDYGMAEVTFYYKNKKAGLFIGAPYKKIALTNLCPAIDGINGFNAAAGVIESSTTYTKYSQNALKINSVEGQSEVYATSTTSLPLDPTHIYYTRIEAYQETSYGTIEMYWPIAEPRPFNLPAKEAGKWNIYSAVVDRSAFTAGDYPFRLDFNSEHDNYIAMSAWYDGWMIVDLTEAFGTGNEPEAAWCDENIPYAVGDFSIELPSDGIAKKAIDMFIGIDGVAKRVKGAFIGINGIAKKVFEASPSIINFTIGGSAYQAEENMTWAKWLGSDYNTDNFVISGDNISASIGTTNMVTTEDGNLVVLEDIIIADYSYDVELQGAGGY